MSRRWYTNVKQIRDKIYLRGYENEEYFTDIIEYKPTFYVKTNKKTEWKTLNGHYLSPIQPGSIRESKDFVDKYREVDGFDLYGNESAVYQFIAERYPEEQLEYDISKINIVAMDIETQSEFGFPDVNTCDEEILLITLQDYQTKKTITWGSRHIDSKVENNTYHYCVNETALLQSFLGYWQSNYPEIVTGWNVNLFDISYLAGRINRLFGESETKKLSPYNWIGKRKVEVRKGQFQSVYDFFGISVVDYLELYKKYSFKKPENFRLDTVAQNELGQKKLDHSQYETFKDFYDNDFDLFTKYNIVDVELISKLEDKLHLIELAIMLAFDSKCNFEDVFYQVRMWDSIVYNHLIRKKIIMPFKPHVSEKMEKFTGAYVKEPIPGSYDYVVSMDLTSLYPHILMLQNISPETLCEERFSGASIDSFLKQKAEIPKNFEYAVCPNGSMYRKDIRGFLPEILDTMFNKRKFYKDKMKDTKKQYEKNPSSELKRQISTYSIKEQSLKVCLNSSYGATGNCYFRFYDLRNAEAVTYTGQLVIQWIERKFNDYFNRLFKTEGVDYVIYADTDSAFLNMKPLVDLVYKDKNPTKEEIVNFLDNAFATKIQDYVDSCFRELSDYLNSYEYKLHMKREKITDRFVILSKKKYIANVWDNEGVRYSEPNIAMTGVEAIRSSTPAFCRDKLREAIKLMMSSDEKQMIDFIQKTKKEFFELPAEDVSFPKSVSEVNKFMSSSTMYVSGTPINSRGSILYNHLIKQNKLTKKYSSIKNGEKIKFCYLKMPNPIRENVIAFPQYLPVEFGLHKYVDYETQFDKSFLTPLKFILDVIGWRTEETVTLDSFFT